MTEKFSVKITAFARKNLGDFYTLFSRVELFLENHLKLIGERLFYSSFDSSIFSAKLISYVGKMALPIFLQRKQNDGRCQKENHH